MSAAARKRRHLARFWTAASLLFVLSCAGSAGPDAASVPAPAEAPAEADSSPSSDRPEPSAPSDPEPRRSGAEATLGGVEWVVVELDGQPVLEGSRISLEFQDDQLSGDASCNRYAAEWTQPAPGRIRIGPARSTLRACAPALMDQERRFLQLLDRFEAATITSDNELILRTGSGEELRATRP